MKIRYLLTLFVFFMLNACNSYHLKQSKAELNLAVQLYSVRDDLKKDFEGTLNHLADMGFQGVEFAGIYGGYEDKPGALKALLDKLGLKAAGAHVKTRYLRDEAFNKTVAFFKALDCKFLIIPWDDRVKSKQGILELAEELNSIAIKLKPYGMQTGYHNHDDEMQDVDGTTYWDILAAATSSNVILQQDVGWTAYANKDPVYYVRKYPNRTLSTHYKAKLPQNAGQDKKPFIGQDIIDWRSLIKANRDVGGTQWYVLEQEDYPEGYTPLQSVKMSLDGLKRVLLSLK